MISNKLLLRQIQKHFGGLENVPPNMHGFLTAITESYDHYEKDHSMLERSIDLSSSEMIELNTELRKETEKLKVAHYELATLFKNTGEIFFSVDMKSFKLTQMSPSCEKIYGYTPEKFYSDTSLWQEIIHPEDKHISDLQLKDLRQGKSVLNQYRIIHKNGSKRWVENKVIPTSNEAGVLIRIDGITSDITERKKAEELLIESEKKYRLVFENPFIGVALGTLEGYVMKANKAFYTLLGYTELEIQNIHFSKFTYALDMDKEVSFIKKMVDGEIDSYELEKRFVTKSNEIIWVELSVSSVKNEANQIQFVIAVIKDITAQKQAKESLVKSEANLRNILDNTDTAYILLNNSANILSYNKVAQQMVIDEMGETLEVGKNYLDLMFEEKREEVKRKIDRVLISEEQLKYEACYQQKNNSIKWFFIRMHPIFNDKKKVIGLSIAATNITHKKKTEVRIKQSNERYELVTKATKDIIWDWNFSNNKMYRSENYKQVFGYSNLNNIHDEAWVENIHPEDRERVQQSINQKANDQTAILWENEYRYYKTNGEITYVQDRAYIIRDEKNKTIRMVGAMRDITSEKLLSIERSKITSDLLQRNRDLEQFAFIVSHNLRSPIVNIIGLIDLVQNHSELDKTDKKKCMDGLLLSTNKLDSVIKDMNHILQVRREISEQKEPVLFSELVADIKISIQNLLEKENAVIKIDFAEVDRIITLKSYIYSIFFNIISNSIKYRNDVTPFITISSHKINNKIVLTFKDNGLGIDLTTQGDKIFGLYNKFHFHTEGKGIGLYMTKTQVEMLGGKISVMSSVNEGTEFSIELQE